ncbi:hypothetical protein ACP4OV_015634 [Aristida adscensionis]
MAPAYALLDIDVRLVAVTGERTGGGQNMSSFVGPVVPAEEGGDAGGGSSRPLSDTLRWALGIDDDEGERVKGLADWVRQGTARLVADGPAGPPPAISTVSLHLPATPREINAHVESVRVASADGNLLALSTGPKLYGFNSSGQSLVHDAAAGALLAPPPINWYDFCETFGARPVVVCRGGGGDFVLAEVLQSEYTNEYSLLLWSHASSGAAATGTGGAGQWVYHDVHLPDGVAGYPFYSDVAFAVEGRWACWADLFWGLLMCDVLSPEPALHFVPLPEEYQSHSFPMVRGRANVYSTAGCVAGEVKLLYMDGYDEPEEVPRDEITISTWTLERRTGQEPGKWRWRRDGGAARLRVGDLWADDSFLAIPGVPRRAPMCPVLNPEEPDLVYFFTSDIGRVDRRVSTKGEYVLVLNLQSKKIQSWSKCPPGRSRELFPSFVAAELCA